MNKQINIFLLLKQNITHSKRKKMNAKIKKSNRGRKERNETVAQGKQLKKSTQNHSKHFVGNFVFIFNLHSP